MTPWPTAPLGRLCRLFNGRAFKPSNWGREGLPIVRIQNLNDPTKPFNRFNGEVKPQHKITTGDILLAWSGTPGTSFGCFIWHDGPAVLNQHIFKVEIDRDRLDDEFFVCAANSKLDEMISLAHGGVGLRHITKQKLETIHLPIPPIPEQQRIVARIKECTERIDEIESLRIETDKMVGALFSAHLNDLWLNGRWPEVALREVLQDTQNGRSIRSDGDAANGRVLTLSAVRTVDLDLSANKPVVIEEDVAQQFHVCQGDVFISRSNTRDLVGLSAMAREQPADKTIFPDLLIRLSSRRDQINPKYLSYALRFPHVRERIQQRASGSSQSMVKISGERLREVRIPLPSLTQQMRIAEQLDDTRRSFSSLEHSLVQPEVAHLKTAVLRKAFAGEL